jgi:serine/tyrosine/threonine adenylyltransferase
MQWNLTRLAETIVALVDPAEERALELASEALRGFRPAFDRYWLEGARRKLGLYDIRDPDEALAHDWVALLTEQRVDHTLAWRRLADLDALRPMFSDHAALDAWLARWQARVDDDALPERLRAANPRIVPRNHHVEQAIDAAYDGDLSPFDRLLEATRDPFGDDPAYDDLAEPAPPGFLDGYQTFCGT